MSAEKRRFIRFSLDIPALRHKKNGEVVQTVLHDVSLNGCLAEWDEITMAGDEFRIEIELPNKNRLPVLCRALHRFPDRGIGVLFIDLSRFERELLGQIISQNIGDDGLAAMIDPFAVPPTFVAENV